MLGMPYISRPPGRSARSKTVTLWPALLSWAAAESPAGPEPTTATFLPVRTGRRRRNDPPLFKAAFNDADLDVLDRNGRIDAGQRAGTFAGGRADTPGELRKVVGLVQPVQRLTPEVAINQVIPLRDQVVDRTAAGHAADQHAAVAERDAAIHAAGALGAQIFVRHMQMELVPVVYTLQR